jgi:hypothetical protein
MYQSLNGVHEVRIRKAREFKADIYRLLLCGSIVTFSHSAIAQPLAQCVKELVSAGVSPNVAADKCVMGIGGTGPGSVDSRIEKYEKCVERNQYTILKGSPKIRGDGKTEYEYSIELSDSGIPSWVRRAGATCWIHGLFNPKVLCWDSEIKREIRDPESAATACRALIPSNSSPGNGTIIIKQSGN